MTPKNYDFRNSYKLEDSTSTILFLFKKPLGYLRTKPHLYRRLSMRCYS